MSFYVKFFSFFTLILLSAIAMMPLQEAISEAMYAVRNDFIQRIEDITGIEIYYSSIRPTIFGSFDIRNLKFMNGEHILFTVSRIRLNFSILELIFQQKTFIHTVQIDKPVFDIDTRRDKESLEFFASLIKNNQSEPSGAHEVTLAKILEVLPRDARYQIRSGSVNFSDKDLHAVIDDMNFNIREDENEIFLDGNIPVQLIYSGLSDKTITVKTQIGLNGLSSEAINGSAADVSFSQIIFSEQTGSISNSSFFNPAANLSAPKHLFSVHPFNVSVSYRNNEINSYKTASENSFAYNFRYNTERSFIFADVSLEDFMLNEIVLLSNNFDKASHLLNTAVNGFASFSYDQKQNKMSYKANINGGDIDSVNPSSVLTDAFRINLSGNEEKISITELNISVSEDTSKLGLFSGNAGLSGEMIFSPFTPSGNIFIDRFSLRGGESISAEFDVSHNRGEILLSSGEIKIAGASIYDFNAFFYPSEKDLGINMSCYNSGAGGLFFDAVYNYAPRQAEASLSLDSITFYDITEITRPFTGSSGTPFFGRSLLKESYISADFFFSTDFNNIVFNAPNVVFNIGESNGSFSVSGTDRHFLLSNGLMNFYRNDLNLSASLFFENPMDLNFNLNASFHDFAWNIEGQILDRTTLIIQDPNGLHVYGNVSGTGAMSGYIEGINFPVPYKSQSMYMNFYSAARFDSPDFWNVDIDHISALHEGNELFNISGAADQNGANLENITITDSEGVLSGNAEIKWNNAFSDVHLTANINDLNETNEYYFIEGGYKNKKININGSFNDMRVNRFTGSENLMLLNAGLQAEWDSIDSFRLNLDVDSFYAYLRNTPLNASVKLNLSDEELMIENLSLSFSELNAAVPKFHFSRAEGIAAARMMIEGYAMEKKVEGNIAFNVNFNSMDSWLDIRNILQKFEGTLDVDSVRYGKFNSENIAFDFATDTGAVSVSGGGNMLRMEMDKDGHFFLGLASPLPIQAAVVGTYSNGNIDAHLSNFFLDMELLYSLVSSTPDFNIAGGYITGQLDIRGPVLNPGFYGYGKASSMCFQAPNYVGADIRVVPFTVYANGYELVYNNVPLATGSGSGTVSGWFHFYNWIPVTLGFDIIIPRDLPVPYGFNIEGFLANGTAAGNLGMIVDLGSRSMELTGNLFTNSAQLGLAMDMIMSPPEKIKKKGDMALTVDMVVTAGSMVEFVWPTSSPIIRVNPEQGSVVYVTHDSQAEVFSVNSNVNIRSGELYYFDRSFFIRQGNIVFNENETRFDPRITARAEIRERSETGPVTISMMVENQPLLSFEPRFIATPSLTQLEIYTILGQNFAGVAGSENADTAQRFLLSSTTDILTQLVASSDVLSQFLFFRQFERQVRDFLKLDMFNVRTRFLQNAVVTGVSSFGENNLVNRNPGVGNYFDNTTVFIGKYIGRDMFVQGMLTMRYDENSRSLGGIVIEPDIGIELQSPYLNIRWDFFPANLDNWWVAGNSITLSWSKSF